MATDDRDPALATVYAAFESLLSRDGAGGSWLPRLLGAAPRGQAALGELAQAPGWLETTVAVRTQTGRRGAFEFLAAPTRRLLAWYIDHPEALARPVDQRAGPETARLRQALLDDVPAGARLRAQDRAHHLLQRSTGLGRDWWRFEDAGQLDCALATDRLVVAITVLGDGPLPPATPWFPQRSRLVRDLEAAHRIADGKPHALLLVSDTPTPDGTTEAVAASVEAGAPHLDADERAALAAGYLGNLTWIGLAEIVGLELPAASRRAV